MKYNRKKLEPDLIKKIGELTSLGYPDKQISENIGVSYSAAQKYSTLFWEEKMKQKE